MLGLDALVKTYVQVHVFDVGTWVTLESEIGNPSSVIVSGQTAQMASPETD